LGLRSAKIGDLRKGDAAIATEYPGFRNRLDKLLESAIEEQEREQQGFMEVLQASRDALTAVRAELDVMRGAVEHQEQAVIDLLDARLVLVARQDTTESLQHRVELLEGEQASLKKALTVKLDAIARSLEAVEWRTQEGMSALANRVAELGGSLTEHAATEGALRELGESIETRQQEVAEAILKALDPVGRIMQVVQSRLVRAASELAVAQGSLFARLVEREERLERQRDQILADLLDEFAGVAKPRERNRIAAGLREADDNRRQRRDAGRTRKRDDGLPPPPLDAFVSGPAGAHDLPDPTPVPQAEAGRRGRRGRKPPL
jgi:chromosome segregation ATPase